MVTVAERIKEWEAGRLLLHHSWHMSMLSSFAHRDTGLGCGPRGQAGDRKASDAVRCRATH